MRSIALIAWLLAPSIAAGVGDPLLPIGHEFQVNTYTPGNLVDVHPSAASDAAGNFVIVWTNGAYPSPGQDGDFSGVFGQRFDASGVALGTEFQVNTYTRYGQDWGNVSSAPDGSFVVAWAGATPSGYNGASARRYDNTGTPIGTQFQVTTYATFNGFPCCASVATAPNGDFVVAWTDYVYPFPPGSTGRDGDLEGVFARRFDSSGSPVGDDFQLSTFTVGSQGETGPDVILDADGNLTAVWSSDQDGSGFGIFARRWDSGGTPVGTEFQVNSYTVNYQNWPSLAADPAGNFVVVWQSVQDGNLGSVQARRFDSAGNTLGTEFQVNTHTLDNQAPSRQAVFADADGRFVIVWDSGVYPFSIDAFGQQFDSDGSPLGTEFQINSYTPNAQRLPAVTGAADGGFVVVWQSQGQDGDFAGEFAQRFGPTETPTSTPTVTPTATPNGACPALVDAGCSVGFEKGALLVKEDVAGKEKLVVKMVKGPALAQTDLGDPVGGGTVFSLCIYDDAGNLAGGAGSSIVVDRAGDPCGSAPCWSAMGGDPPGGKGYKYLDGALASGGVLKILYKGGDAGKSKAIVKGKGPNLPDGIPAALQTSTFATVQLRSSDGICLSVVVDDIKKQSPASFKAKFSAP